MSIYFFIFFQIIFFNSLYAYDVDLSNIDKKGVSACTTDSTSLLDFEPITKNIEKALEKIAPRLQNSDCAIVQNNGLDALVNGKLSALWGLDFIGVDLAHEALTPLGIQMIPVKTATSENVNLKEVPTERLSLRLKELAKTQESQVYYGHGTSVANIIYGNSPFGISTKAELTLTNIFAKSTDDKNSVLNDLISNKIKVFQSSESVKYPEELTKMRELGIISFRSAGNDHPTDEISQAAPETSVIVGQLSPIGGMSSDSSSYKEVQIAAPGRVYSFRNGETHLFGGTSGSQPIATGCFLNVVSLLPDITPSEADLMIEKSAIPTLNSHDKTKRNGKGTINCLKLAKVAMRLKEEWPKNRAKIVDSLLYDFKNESNHFVEGAEKLKESKNPCAIALRLKLLRQAFLLDSNNKKTIENLALLYRRVGYPGNANLFQSMIGFSSKQIKELYTENKGSEFEADVIRLVADFYPEQESLFLDSINSSDEDTVLLSAHLGKNKIPKVMVLSNFLRIFKEDKINGMTSPNFLKEYFENYKFPASDILKVCESNIAQWEKDQSDNVITCLLASSYDQKAAPLFVLKQLKRKSGTFKKIFLNIATTTIQADKNMPNLLSVVVNSPEWTKDERDQISEIIKQAPAN